MAARDCSPRTVTLRLDRRLRQAVVRVGGRRLKVRRRDGRLVVRVARRPGRATIFRVRGVTRDGRRVATTRRVRACR